MSEVGLLKKKRKISASTAVAAKASVDTTWAAWKDNPLVAVRVVISHIKEYGGSRGDKKPSWMLLTPSGDVEMRRYTCWECSILKRLELSIGSVCDIVGFCEVSAYGNIMAFVPNFSSSPYEIIGKNNLVVSYKSDIMIGGTAVPFLTAPLIHQNASVGRLSCGVVEVVTQPMMTTTKSMYKDHENEDDVAKLSFNAKLNDGSIAEINVWGSFATSSEAQLIQEHSRVLIMRALAKLDGSLSISPRNVTASDSVPIQPNVIVLMKQQTVTHVADLDVVAWQFRISENNEDSTIAFLTYTCIGS
ncbi:hypothetical protein MHU86_3576 [Fragilaria crotonensis]|nr:hypothetical protein MHU86_3576 [Fragilaria crotonensis]